MKPDETEFGRPCPQCGALCEDSYCYICEVDFSVRREPRDEDAFEHMQSGWKRNAGDGFSEPGSLTDPDYRPQPPKSDANRKEKKRKEKPPRSEPDPSTQPRPRSRKSHLLQFPEKSIPELLEMYRGGGGHSPETRSADAAPTSLPTQNTEPAEFPPEQAPKSHASTDIARESPPISDAIEPIAPDASIPHLTSLHHEVLDKMSEEELCAHLTRIKTMSEQPVTWKEEPAKELSPSYSQPPPPEAPLKTPSSSLAPTFFALWALITASAYERKTPFLAAVIVSAMLSAFLSVFVSTLIDWIRGIHRK